MEVPFISHIIRRLAAVGALFLALGALPINKAHADRWDASGNVRAGLPGSGGVHLWGGYNLLLWGEYKKNDESLSGVERISYGYIRPHIHLVSAGVYNQGDARLTVAPISFLESVFGYGFYRLTMSPNKVRYSCGSYKCQSLMQKAYFEQTIKWKLWLLYGCFRFRWDRITPGQAGPFVDPIFQLNSKHRFDNAISWGGGAGFFIVENLKLGGYYDTTRFLKEGSQKHRFINCLKLQTETENKWAYSFYVVVREKQISV